MVLTPILKLTPSIRSNSAGLLLRDMINWCIEHPVKGKVLKADNPKMRALEAYIYGQRKGVPLAYGKR